jgi:hypothetical protein
MSRVLLAVGLLAAATPCFADEDSLMLAAAFGNTIVSTYPDGRTAELWLQPDGAYTAEGRHHDRSNGHWDVKDGKLCLKQAHPFAFGFVYCTQLSQFATGSVWISRAVTGETIRIRLVRGRQDPADEG